MPPSRPRVAVIHQGFVPPYRVAFFERLAQASDLEYVVFHGQAPSSSGHDAAPGPFAFPDVRVHNREVRVASTGVVLQPIVRRIVSGGFSAAVVGAELKFPAALVAAALLRARGGAVVLWGQGYEKAEDRPGAVVRAVATAAKLRLARRADGYLVYTDGGARRLAEDGVDPDRVTVVRNTLDMDSQERLHARFADFDERELRAELGLQPDSVVFLYLGRVYREKRVDELVEVARRLAGRRGLPPLEWAIVGDGPDIPRVADLARAVPGIRLLGGVHNEELARWLRLAAAVTIPGKVGLAVNHALAHGVPVLTRESDLHAPEVEYLENGRNSLIVPGDLSAYAEELAGLATAPERLAALGAGALESRERLSLDRMVQAFDAGVRHALVRRNTERSRRPGLGAARGRR